ncbi:MAG: hypothetical protein IJ499_02210 [Clostridia bacterium]|nr:hypothetical protein [Clostridia bacterium]
MYLYYEYHYDDSFGSIGYTERKRKLSRYDVTIDTSDLCSSATMTLNRIQDQYKHQAINYKHKSVTINYRGYPASRTDGLSFFNFYDDPNGHKRKLINLKNVSYIMHYNTIDFQSAIDKLKTPDIIAAEISHIKHQEEYSRFINSSFYKELYLCLLHLYQGEFKIPYEHIGAIKICNDNSFSDYFSIDLYSQSSEYFDDDKLYVNFFECKYRKLTVKEISMLAIALHDDFPNYVKISWEHFFYSQNQNMLLGSHTTYRIQSHLIPIFICQSKTNKEYSGPKDIY